MTPWSLRRAAPGDAEALALVGAATFLETYAGEMPGADIVAHCAARHGAALYAEWLDRGWATWLAEAPQGAPLGYAVLAEPDIPQRGPGDLELKRIYVLSRLHGSGAGQALFGAALEEARARGAPRLLLGAYARNHRALAFYRRCGFREVGSRSFTVGGVTFDDDVVMALDLAEAGAEAGAGAG